MFCLLCHEKISRLRAWRTKSEFCSDEHAEIYKRQTLERLLTDHETSKPAEAPPLPVDHGPAGKASSREVEETTPAAATLARFAEEDARPVVERGLEPGSEPQSLEHASADEGLQELWRLAEEVSPAAADSDDEGWSSAAATGSADALRLQPGAAGLGGLGSSLGGLGKGLGSGLGGIREQTAEEALAALRELSGGRRTATSLEESSDELDTLLSARGLDESSAEVPELSPGASFPSTFDDTLAGEEALSLLDAASLEPLDDDELPSILERLTEHAAEVGGLEAKKLEAEELEAEELEAEELEAEELDLAAAPAAAELMEELQTPPEWAEHNPLAEEAFPAETGLTALAAAAEQEQAVSEPAAKTESEEPPAFDLIEEAVESHLEEAAEPASQRGASRKVVPFPLSRPSTASRGDSKEAAPGDVQPAASAGPGRASAGKPGKGSKGAKGMAGDLSRLQLKPVAVMFGLEPTLREPAAEPQGLPAGLGARPGLDRVVEPPMSYPDAGGGRRAGVQLPLHARLFPLLPETPEPGPLEGVAGPADWPDYRMPCVKPGNLPVGRNRESGGPSVGSERAWMFRIEPALAEGPEFALELPDGNSDAAWQAPWLPAALVLGLSHPNGSGKLDLSGPEGRFEPSVDRLCLVFPQPGELGAGIPRTSSSHTPGEELGGWMPPTVLDPRFEIERPAGRDLSDFG